MDWFALLLFGENASYDIGSSPSLEPPYYSSVDLLKTSEFMLSLQQPFPVKPLEAGAATGDVIMTYMTSWKTFNKILLPRKQRKLMKNLGVWMIILTIFDFRP